MIGKTQRLRSRVASQAARNDLDQPLANLVLAIAPFTVPNSEPIALGIGDASKRGALTRGLARAQPGLQRTLTLGNG